MTNCVAARILMTRLCMVIMKAYNSNVFCFVFLSFLSFTVAIALNSLQGREEGVVVESAYFINK